MLGGLLVELKHIGRKGTLSASTLLTGVFILASTTAHTSNALLGWNCAYSFCSNVMYAVLYAYTPEIFPTKDRGTGNALTATANRVFGIMGRSVPLIVVKLTYSTDRGDVWRSGYSSTGLRFGGFVCIGRHCSHHITVRVKG